MRHKKGFYEKYIKCPQDFILALLALAVLSPVLLVIAVMVRIKLGSPVIFKQERPGLNGKIFKLRIFSGNHHRRQAPRPVRRNKILRELRQMPRRLPLWA